MTAKVSLRGLPLALGRPPTEEERQRLQPMLDVDVVRGEMPLSPAGVASLARSIPRWLRGLRQANPRGMWESIKTYLNPPHDPGRRNLGFRLGGPGAVREKAIQDVLIGRQDPTVYKSGTRWMGAGDPRTGTLSRRLNLLEQQPSAAERALYGIQGVQDYLDRNPGVGRETYDSDYGKVWTAGRNRRPASAAEQQAGRDSAMRAIVTHAPTRIAPVEQGTLIDQAITKEHEAMEAANFEMVRGTSTLDQPVGPSPLVDKAERETRASRGRLEARARRAMEVEGTGALAVPKQIVNFAAREVREAAEAEFKAAWDKELAGVELTEREQKILKSVKEMSQSAQDLQQMTGGLSEIIKRIALGQAEPRK